MTPKEKAKELVRQMLNVNESFNYDIEYMSESMAKDSALICVSELIQSHYGSDKPSELEYWQEVKKEIELL